MPSRPVQPSDASAFPFSPREFQRLCVYRAAVEAGFYTDSCSSSFGHRSPESDLQRLMDHTLRPAA